MLNFSDGSVSRRKNWREVQGSVTVSSNNCSVVIPKIWVYPPYASENCKIHKAYANSVDKECLEKEMHSIFDNWGLLEFLGMIVSWLTQSDQSDFSIGGVYF